MMSSQPFHICCNTHTVAANYSVSSQRMATIRSKMKGRQQRSATRRLMVLESSAILGFLHQH